ncbi:MAG: amidohydrolase [candidate division Zixibacteria bacterium]|nr:amidohydrolase [candidate division Zixibacteria bacterium]
MNQNNNFYREILHRVKKNHKRQIARRRHFHRFPEISNREFKTTSFIRREIKKLGFREIPIKLKTGLLAELSGKKPGPTVAIRTDIDALPVTEKTGLAYKSRNEGCMHACGHDMHMAAILGTGLILSELRDRWPGRLRLIFQPAEEMPPGGAEPMIKNGALKGVDMILGLHVDPDIPTGRITLRDGITMASVYDFDIIVTSRGGHAARPHLGVDALVTAAEIIESLQKVVSRDIDPITPVAITFGTIRGGVARNTIAERVHIEGTVRTLSQKNFKKIPALIKRTVNGICRARGAEYEIIPVAVYPPLKNHPAVNRRLRKNYETLFGRGRITESELILGGEDFAFYLREVPGAMFRLGIRNERIKADQPWHSPRFIADENALVYGTALLAATALDYLMNGKQ